MPRIVGNAVVAGGAADRTAAATTSPSTPTRRRRHFAARCRRRNRLPRHRSRPMRRSQRPRIICSPIPTPRSRARPCCRWPRCRIGSIPRARASIPAAPRWNFEIPFATPQGTAMAQFEISRDGGGNEVEAAKRVWRARFSLDVEPAGPVHALVSLSRRQDLGADVGGAARDRGAIARRRGAIEPGAQQGRTPARRHRDPRRHAAATGAGAAPGISWIARYERGDARTSSRSRCITTGPARRASSPRARARSAPRSSRSPKPMTSRSRRTRCWPARSPTSNSATRFRPSSTRRWRKC